MFGKAMNKAGKSSIIIPLGMGLGCTGLMTLIGGILTAVLINIECLPETKIGLAAVVILCAASFGGAVITAKKAGAKRTVLCLANGSLYFLLLAIINLLCYDGAFQGALGSALTIIGCSLVASLLGRRQNRQKISYFRRR